MYTYSPTPSSHCPTLSPHHLPCKHTTPSLTSLVSISSSLPPTSCRYLTTSKCPVALAINRHERQSCTPTHDSHITGGLPHAPSQQLTSCSLNASSGACWKCACMHVSMYACSYMYVCLDWMYVCSSCLCMYICSNLNVYACIYCIYIYVCIFVYVYMHMFSYIGYVYVQTKCICMHVYTRMYMHMSLYMHMCTCIHI